jgi:hypothetical protein
MDTEGQLLVQIREPLFSGSLAVTSVNSRVCETRFTRHRPAHTTTAGRYSALQLLHRIPYLRDLKIEGLTAVRAFQHLLHLCLMG